MNKERYVSYDVAKLLKEKGFDWRVFNFYDEHERFSEHIGSVYTLYNWNHPEEDGRFSQYCSAPTQQMACDWLREEHEIDIIPIIRHSLKYAQESPFRDYACRVYDCDGNIVLSATKWYSRYENAVEAALEYCLKNII